MDSQTNRQTGQQPTDRPTERGQEGRRAEGREVLQFKGGKAGSGRASSITFRTSIKGSLELLGCPSPPAPAQAVLC